MKSSSSLFHPLIQKWFSARYGLPTDVQEKSWPLIASGRNVLITAPTGSGKTLAAFLWAINQLLSGEWSPGVTCLLYVSPLKALNNDVRENLLVPLAEIRTLFSAEGMDFPLIRVQTRSGDTPGSERQKILKHPPEMLITTPESLNLMLSSRKARELFRSVKSVILDEMHSVLSTKRGSHLITAVDRLVLIAGNFQRIALSATVKPLDVAKEFIGGYIRTNTLGGTEYRKREVSVVVSRDTKKFEVEVRYPVKAAGEESLFPSLVRECRKIIWKNRSTLFFTNTRRLCEKIAWMINEGEERDIAYSHHGSLSKEIRSTVERELREGRLSSIVATSSLELGIDIGALDEVVLIQSPQTVVSGIQRIGRAGHAVGSVSRGIIYPTHGRDLIDAAVCARGIMEIDIEDARPVKEPIDVLAQVIISMTGLETWKIDDLYSVLRTSYPFHSLSYEMFQRVLEMLSGRYKDTRVRELSPRIILDRIDRLVRGKEGVLLLVYRSGGTIPDRGYYGMLHRDTGSKIGELDEEFVWERKIGDTFSLGVQSWQITHIDNQNVEVAPWRGPVGIAPFWKAERGLRGFHLFERIGEFLEYANRHLDADNFAQELQSRYFMQKNAAEELLDFLKRQKTETRCALPHRHHVVCEHLSGPLQPAGMEQLFLYTFWGGRVNMPLSLILSAACEQQLGRAVDVFCDDDALLFIIPRGIDIPGLLDTIHQDNLLHLLREKLEHTGFFGARFRENAGRALLLPRGGFQKRFPLWLNRVRSKKLFSSVSGYRDFPITVETWRECLEDEFEMDTLRVLLQELNTGSIAFSETWTEVPSPFANGLIWWQTNTYMYSDDTLKTAGAPSLSEEIFQQVLFSAPIRPQIDGELSRRFQEKLHRESHGYVPDSTEELIEWVKERILIPLPEWTRLIEAVRREQNLGEDEMLGGTAGKIGSLRLPGSSFRCIAASESLPKILGALRVDFSALEWEAAGAIPPSVDTQRIQKAIESLPTGEEEETRFGVQELLSEWLYSYGPIDISYMKDVFGLPEMLLEEHLATLAEERRVVIGRLLKDAESDQVCDAQNLESLLRISRAASRPVFQPLGGKYLPLFLAQVQGIVFDHEMPEGKKSASSENLKVILEQLFGYPANVELWESDLFPARLRGYQSSWLDSLFNQSDLLWFGCGERRASFCFFQDYPLFREREWGEEDRNIHQIFPDTRGRYSMWEMREGHSLKSDELFRLLWDGVWKGTVLHDSWNSIRSGDYKKNDRALQPSRRRVRSDRWRSGRLFSGSFYLYQSSLNRADPLDLENPVGELELNKERVRQLLLRYGVLFRELLENELPALRWHRLFKALRIMELSGELIGGYFFQGIRGIQFISHQAFRLIRGGIREDAVYWMNACDPASLCGVRCGGQDARLPARKPENHIVYRGTQLVLVSRRRGKELEILVPPHDPRLKEYFCLFRTFLDRDFHPPVRLRVERVNGMPAQESPYMDDLSDFGFKRGYRHLTLERSF